MGVGANVKCPPYARINLMGKRYVHYGTQQVAVFRREGRLFQQGIASVAGPEGL